jgi:5'-methylthioadenosine/S-adenosylhomocysteine nucleosidase
MIGVFGALREEVAFLWKRMNPRHGIGEPTYHMVQGSYRGKELLVAQTGIGKKRAEAVTRFALDNYPVTTLITMGFGGALNDDLKGGDVVLCSCLHCANSNSIETKPKAGAFCTDERTVSLAAQAMECAAVEFSLGVGVTVPQMVLEPEDKQRLGNTFDADIVDMESYWIAKIAMERRIPFLVIRSVSDTRQERLLPFDQLMTAEGRVQWGSAAVYFVRNARRLSEVPRLYRNVRLAQRSLATSIDSLIAEL